jgi:hypothetical protein
MRIEVRRQRSSGGAVELVEVEHGMAARGTGIAVEHVEHGMAANGTPAIDPEEDVDELSAAQATADERAQRASIAERAAAEAREQAQRAHDDLERAGPARQRTRFLIFF